MVLVVRTAMVVMVLTLVTVVVVVMIVKRGDGDSDLADVRGDSVDGDERVADTVVVVVRW